jgi:hypothetical protein
MPLVNVAVSPADNAVTLARAMVGTEAMPVVGVLA